MTARVSSLMLLAVATLLVGLPFLALAQVAPSVPFAPGGSGSGGGGGCPGPACDAEYLRLDTSNDPLTGGLVIDHAGTALSPSLSLDYGADSFELFSAAFAGRDTLWGSADGLDFLAVGSDGTDSELFLGSSGSDYVTFYADGTGVQSRVDLVSAGDAAFALTGLTNNLSFDKGGTIALPDVWSIEGTRDTGLFWPSADSVAFTVGGANRLDLSTSAITIIEPILGGAESAAGPTYSFSSDTNTGIFWISPDVFGAATGGVLRWRWASTGHTSTVPLLVPVGTVGAPTYAFTGDTNTGFYSPGSDWAAVSAGGTQSMSWTGLSTVAGVRIEPGSLSIDLGLPGQYFDDIYGDTYYVHADAVGTPGFAWIADTDTGFYQPSADVVGVTTGGVETFTFTTTRAETRNVRPKTDNTSDLGSGSFRYANGYIENVLAENIDFGNGTLADPSLQLESEATGFYRVSAGTLGVSLGGNLAGAFGTDGTFGRGFDAASYLAAPAIKSKAITPAEAASITCASGTLGAILTASDGTNAETCICGLRSSVYDWEPMSGATCSFF